MVSRVFVRKNVKNRLRLDGCRACGQPKWDRTPPIRKGPCKILQLNEQQQTFPKKSNFIELSTKDTLQHEIIRSGYSLLSAVTQEASFILSSSMQWHPAVFSHLNFISSSIFSHLGCAFGGFLPLENWSKSSLRLWSSVFSLRKMYRKKKRLRLDDCLVCETKLPPHQEGSMRNPAVKWTTADFPVRPQVQWAEESFGFNLMRIMSLESWPPNSRQRL